MEDKYPTAKLATVAEIVMGQSPPGSTYNKGGEGLPFYQGVVDFGTRYPSRRVFCSAPSRIAETGDILFSVRAPIGHVNIATERCCVGRGLSIIKPKDPEDRVYIEFVLRAMPSMWGIFEGGGSVFGNARKEDLQSLEIVWPRAGERRAIAAILGALDDKIELNRQMNRTLEEVAQAIFKSWFVDFKPFLEQGMQDSPLGPIPRGWRVSAFGDITENLRRGVHPNNIKARTPYIGLEHMPRHCIALSEWGNADELESNKFEFKRGEILFGKLRPYFHKVGVAPLNGVCSTDILVITAKEPNWFGFVLGHVSSIEFVSHTDTASTGTKMPRTNWHDMALYRVVLPPKHVAETFTERVSPLIDRITANIYDSHALALIRDTLLPKLLSGEINVKEPEEYIAA